MPLFPFGYSSLPPQVMLRTIGLCLLVLGTGCASLEEIHRYNAEEEELSVSPIVSFARPPEASGIGSHPISGTLLERAIIIRAPIRIGRLAHKRIPVRLYLEKQGQLVATDEIVVAPQTDEEGTYTLKFGIPVSVAYSAAYSVTFVNAKIYVLHPDNPNKYFASYVVRFSLWNVAGERLERDYWTVLEAEESAALSWSGDRGLFYRFQFDYYGTPGAQVVPTLALRLVEDPDKGIRLPCGKVSRLPESGLAAQWFTLKVPCAVKFEEIAATFRRVHRLEIQPGDRLEVVSELVGDGKVLATATVEQQVFAWGNAGEIKYGLGAARERLATAKRRIGEILQVFGE